MSDVFVSGGKDLFFSILRLVERSVGVKYEWRICFRKFDGLRVRTFIFFCLDFCGVC